MKLSGNKTYITGIAMICYAVGGAVAGKLEITAAIAVVLAALSLMGLRHGITTGN